MDRRRNVCLDLDDCVYLARQQASSMVYQCAPKILLCIFGSGTDIPFPADGTTMWALSSRRSGAYLKHIYRYCAATVYGSHLRFDQFCIVCVLGKREPRITIVRSLNHVSNRITPHRLSSFVTATKASSSPHSFTSCSPTFLQTRMNKRISFASTDCLMRMTVNANGED